MVYVTLDTLYIIPYRRSHVNSGNVAEMEINPDLKIVIRDGQGKIIREQPANVFFTRANWSEKEQKFVTESNDPGAMAKFEYPIVSKNGLRVSLKRTREEVPGWEQGHWWWFGCRAVKVLNRNVTPPEENIPSEVRKESFVDSEGKAKDAIVVNPNKEGVLKNLELVCPEQDVANYQIEITYPNSTKKVVPAIQFLTGLSPSYLKVVSDFEYNHVSFKKEGGQVHLKLKLPFFVKPGFQLRIFPMKKIDVLDTQVRY